MAVLAKWGLCFCQDTLWHQTVRRFLSYLQITTRLEELAHIPNFDFRELVGCESTNNGQIKLFVGNLECSFFCSQFHGFCSTSSFFSPDTSQSKKAPTQVSTKFGIFGKIQVKISAQFRSKNRNSSRKISGCRDNFQSHLNSGYFYIEFMLAVNE